MSILKVNTIQDRGGNAIISSDGSGNLTQTFASNTPAFFAKMSADQTVVSDTNTVVAFNTEVYDTDSAYDTSAYKFTVPSGKAGKYIFTFTIGYTNPANNTSLRYQFMFFKNGSLEDFSGDWAQSGNSSADPTWNFTTQMNLSVGDYVQAVVSQNRTEDEVLTAAYGRFYGYKLIGV